MFLLRVLPNTAQILPKPMQGLEKDEVHEVHLVLAFIMVDHNESKIPFPQVAAANDEKNPTAVQSAQTAHWTSKSI